MKGIQFKKFREKQGLSQEDVAKILGISRQAYGRYESGERECSFASLKMLSRIFCASIDELLDNSKETVCQIKAEAQHEEANPT